MQDTYKKIQKTYGNNTPIARRQTLIHFPKLQSVLLGGPPTIHTCTTAESLLFLRHSFLTALISTCSRLVEGAQLAVSQGIVYEIVLVHHAPLVSISSTVALPSSQLLACQRSNKERQTWDAWNIIVLHMLRPKDVQATRWDLQAPSWLLLASSTSLGPSWAAAAPPPHERNTPCPWLRFETSRCDLRENGRVVIWDRNALWNAPPPWIPRPSLFGRAQPLQTLRLAYGGPGLIWSYRSPFGK